MTSPADFQLLRHATAVAVVFLVSAFGVAEAEACGGLFCSRATQAQPQPAPVDQSAENILFEVHGDGTITAHVQIEYAGDADSFAWIVPVPSTPEVSDSSASVFAALDASSRPTVQLPQLTQCNPPGFAFSGGDDGGGCGGELQSDSSGSAESPGIRDIPMPNESPVTVYDLGSTATYEFVVLGSSEAMDLVEWLVENGYNVSENMIPVMEPYNQAGTRFLALKLREGRSATDIAPIKMRYMSAEPMVPIQLTAVAAQPYMGIRVFIVGDDPYVPRNYDNVTPNGAALLYDGQSNVNYFDWVAREVEDGGGQRFITEYIGPNGAANTVPGTTLSRFYTRMSPEHMTLDPIFRIAGSASRSGQSIDLTGNMPIMTCDENAQPVVIPGREPSACAFNYCGPDSTCHEIDGAAACVCGDGRVAQEINGPDGPRVVCTPADNPFGVTAQAAGVGTLFDPCGAVECGAGRCVVKAGFPACECPEGTAAQRGATTSGLGCVVLELDAPAFGPGGGPESAGRLTPVPDFSAAAQIVAPRPVDSGWLALFAVPAALGAGLLVGRRRRRRQREA